MPFTPTPHPGTLHHYTPRLVAFEHALPHSPAHPAPTNIILFLSGLGDGLLTVRYPTLLSTLLPPHWSLAEVLLSCSYTGWTTSPLSHSASELASAVAYFRSLLASRTPSGHDAADAARTSTNIVLMGHSTGCQIIAEYLIGPRRSPRIPACTLARPAVDGIILQAGISDAEAMRAGMSAAVYASSCAVAQKYVDEGRAEEMMPVGATAGFFGAQATAGRWLSLASPDGLGEDDYFSSDAGEEGVERVFGEGGLRGRGVRVLVLMGGEDEFVPGWVDKVGLVERWRGVLGEDGWDGDGGVVEGATHNLNRSGKGVVEGLCRRVARFLEKVEGRDGERERGKL